MYQREKDDGAQLKRTEYVRHYEFKDDFVRTKKNDIVVDESGGETMEDLKKQLEKLKRENSELKQKNENEMVNFEDITFDEIFVSDSK